MNIKTKDNRTYRYRTVYNVNRYQDAMRVVRRARGGGVTDVAMREEVKEEEELVRVATDHRTRVLPRLAVAACPADCFVTFADDGNFEAVLDDGSARGASSVTLCVTPAAASRRFCPQ